MCPAYGNSSIVTRNICLYQHAYVKMNLSIYIYIYINKNIYIYIYTYIPSSARHVPGRKFQKWDMTIGTSLLIGIVGELGRNELK